MLLQVKNSGFTAPPIFTAELPPPLFFSPLMLQHGLFGSIFYGSKDHYEGVRKARAQGASLHSHPSASEKKLASILAGG